MPAPRLNKQHKEFIVTSLAMFDKPAFVQERVKELFGIDLTINAVRIYDAKHPHFAEQWRPLFDRTRQEWIDQTGDSAVKHKAVRIKILEDIVENERKKNPKIQNNMLILTTLKQIAQEMGGAFTNKRELSGPGGGPIQTTVVTTDKAVAAYMGWLNDNPKAKKADKEKWLNLLATGAGVDVNVLRAAALSKGAKI